MTTTAAAGNGSSLHHRHPQHLLDSPSSLHSDAKRENNDGLMKDESYPTLPEIQAKHDFLETFMGVIGNVLEWYDFAVFGFLSDIIGDVFFPPQAGNAATVESFAVFGGAFLMRPVGGLLMGYIGDVYGRKKALFISIFLMAFPTFAMGCLPGYEQVGPISVVLLVIVRLLQGLSVGGQLMSSLVFTLENHEPEKWGLYGSFVMAAANFGTLLGGLAGFVLRATLNREQLMAWGWRLPFLSGIIVSTSGFYLRGHGEDHVPAGHLPVRTETEDDADASALDEDDMSQTDEIPTTPTNPLRLAFAKGNLRALAASAMVPMLWAAGFYLSFVWMAIYMADLIDEPVPHPFAVNSAALLLSVCIFFPFAGILSDRYGRRRIMTIGGVSMGVLSPFLVMIIGVGHPIAALCAQSLMGIALSFWGAPMCAWLVESFHPEARLTSVAIGYNVAQATAGGLTPSIATILVDTVGPNTPGLILTVLAAVSLSGLWCVAPPTPAALEVPQFQMSEHASPETEMVVTEEDMEENELI